MKKKFNLLMIYFKSAGLEDVSFTIQTTNKILEFVDFHTKLNVTGVIDDIFEEIFNLFSDKIIDNGLSNVYEDTFDNYKILGRIDTNKKVIYFEDFEYMISDTQESGSQYNLEDIDDSDISYGIDKMIENINEILKNLNVSELTIQYSGSGDDGYISNEYTSNNGDGETPSELKDICYKLLEHYGGWEINEGSEGSFTFTQNKIDHQHFWNVIENELVGLNFEINEEMFDE